MTEDTRVVVVSKAQARVLGELLRDGADYRTIGLRLGISVDTVKSHVKVLLKKTGCRSATALVVEVLREFVVCVSPSQGQYTTVEPPT